MPDLPAISDPLNPLFQTQVWLAEDAFNNEDGEPIGALPEAQQAQEPTAEGANGTRAALKAFANYVQGLTPITALQIDGFFRPPVYTTAALPAATTGEARLVYDTTTNRLKSSNGTSWDQYLAAGDVTPGVAIFAEGGGVDDTATRLIFDEGQFAIAEADPGEYEIAIGTLDASSLPASAGRQLTGSVTALDYQDANENDLMTYTLAANVLDANSRRVVIEIFGDTFNTGAGRNAQLRLYLGGVLVLSDVWAHSNLNARKPWRMAFSVISISQSVQATRLFLNSATANTTAPTVGIAGTLSSSTGGPTYEVIGADSAADRTATIALRVSLQHDTATANFRTRVQTSRVTVI